MSGKYIFRGLTILGVIFEIGGDVFFKKSVVDNKHIYLWIGFVIYSIGTIFWALSLKYETLSKAISIFTVLNLIIATLIGVFFFKEELSIEHKIGIALGIVSIVLLEL